MAPDPPRPRRGIFRCGLDYFWWLFQPPAVPVTTGGVCAWWQSRRVFYNFLVGVLASPLLILHLITFLVVLVGANIAYTAGPLCDAVLRRLRPRLSPLLTPVFFAVGIVFSAAGLIAGPFLALGAALFLPLLSAGTWEDDKANWQRAFGQEQPKDITVVHSWYCQTPHFTHESQYFFEIAPNRALYKAYTDPERVLLVTPENGTLQQSFDSFPFMNQPTWFAPKPLTAYQIFQGKPPNDNYFLFVDRESDAIFITSRIGM